jgi:hypothetical protein
LGGEFVGRLGGDSEGKRKMSSCGRGLWRVDVRRFEGRLCRDCLSMRETRGFGFAVVDFAFCDSSRFTSISFAISSMVIYHQLLVPKTGCLGGTD